MAGPLFFMHVPKTAGSSVRGALANTFLAQRTLLVGRDLSGIAHLPDLDFLSAHASIAARQRLGPECRVVTFLRDPARRAISNFFFARGLPDRDPQRPETILTKGMSLPEALERADELPAIFGNLQTAYLCGRERPEADALEVDETDLARALRSLEEDVFFLGLSEHVSESMLMLSLALDLKFAMTTGELNRSSWAAGADALGVTERRRLDQILALDGALYEAAARRFRRDRGAIRLRRGLGVRDVRNVGDSSPTPTALHFSPEHPVPGPGWHHRDRHSGLWWLWSGPHCESSLAFVWPHRGALAVTGTIRQFVAPEVEESFRLLVNRDPVELVWQFGPAGKRFRADVSAATVDKGEGNLVFSFSVCRTICPRELDPHLRDVRDLGFALGDLDVRADAP